VTGIDLSPEMLRQAERKLQGKSVVLLEGDILTYEGFRDESFDAVVISLVLEHVEELEPFLLKVQKLLKPSGRVYISEIHPERTAKGVLAHFKEPIEGREIHLQGFAHTQLDFSEAIQRTGFRVVEFCDVLGSEALAELNLKWKKHIGCPMIQMWILEKK
jgi:malonyl-CoA O-methyltransferase